VGDRRGEGGRAVVQLEDAPGGGPGGAEVTDLEPVGGAEHGQVPLCGEVPAPDGLAAGDPPADFVEAAHVQQEPRSRDAQPGVGPHVRVRQQVEPAGDRAQAPGVEPLRPGLGDELRGQVRVTGGDVVGHGVPGGPGGRRPRRGPAMQGGHDGRLREGQLVTEQFAEQPVVAEPPPPGVDRAEEDAGALRAVEEGCGVRATGDRPARLGREPAQDGGAQDELPQVGREAASTPVPR
jgi:hypothetical protein